MKLREKKPTLSGHLRLLKFGHLLSQPLEWQTAQYSQEQRPRPVYKLIVRIKFRIRKNILPPTYSTILINEKITKEATDG